MNVLRVEDDEARKEPVAEILIAGSPERGGMTIEMSRSDVVERACSIKDNPEGFRGTHYNVQKMCDTLVEAHDKILTHEEEKIEKELIKRGR
jgi:hypothetical protein